MAKGWLFLGRNKQSKTEAVNVDNGALEVKTVGNIGSLTTFVNQQEIRNTDFHFFDIPMERRLLKDFDIYIDDTHNTGSNAQPTTHFMITTTTSQFVTSVGGGSLAHPANDGILFRWGIGSMTGLAGTRYKHFRTERPAQVAREIRRVSFRSLLENANYSFFDESSNVTKQIDKGKFADSVYNWLRRDGVTLRLAVHYASAPISGSISISLGGDAR